MLYEFNTRQIPGEPRRRWFADDYFDLIVWYSDTAAPIGFQLCYGKQATERALTWTADQGFRHDRIDDERAPILVPDRRLCKAELLPRFRERASKLEPELRTLVQARLEQCPA
jgi:hypothetical protein